MKQAIIKEAGVSYGINNLLANKVLILRDKGIKSPLKIAGIVHLPVSYVSRILKANRRKENGNRKERQGKK